MARKRIGMKKIREIIRFREDCGMSDRKIARALNISRPVVAQLQPRDVENIIVDKPTTRVNHRPLA